MDKSLPEVRARAKELTRAVIGLLGSRSPTQLTLGGRVGDVMTRGVVACADSAYLNDVAQVLWDQDCGVVPITGKVGHLVGVLTDRDLCMSALLQGKALSEIKVANVLSGAVHYCLESDPLDRAVSLLRVHGVRRLPVLNAKQQLVGILSLADIAGYIASLDVENEHAHEILTRLLAALSRSRNSRRHAKVTHV